MHTRPWLPALTHYICFSRYGLNLYDAGTWEIALALSNEFEMQYVYERQVLDHASTGSDVAAGGLKDIRADTKDFQYGPSKVLGNALPMVTLPANASNPNDPGGAGANTKMNGAYFYRMISDCYNCEDPLLGKYSYNFVYNKTADPTGSGPSWDTSGLIIWNDWKPITGEQAWATMIGPLNFLHVLYNGSIPKFSSFAAAPPQVQLGISILPAVSAMQSAPGSMYHCPKGTDMFPADNDEAENVSNENNFSMYAGLRILEFILAGAGAGATDPVIAKAKTDVDKLIAGLEKWFETGLFSEPLATGNRVVYQGGHVSFAGQYTPVGIQEYAGFAVDCQTWGLATLVPYKGLKWVEGKLGAGGAAKLWTEVKTRAGHFVNGSIAGVGFTEVIEYNATTKKNVTAHEVWSAEWSFGAVTMLRTLAEAYTAAGQASQATSLLADAGTIMKAVMTPTCMGGLNNNCTKEQGGAPYSTPQVPVAGNGGMLYANTRFFIPWGWYANPVSSLCSTSWSIMAQHSFNPFVLGGKNVAPKFDQNGYVPPRIKALGAGHVDYIRQVD